LQKNHKRSQLETARLDILLNDAMLRLSYHLNFGKVIPSQLDADWNLRRKFLTTDPVAKINWMLRSDKNLKKFLSQSLNLGPFYQDLINALAQYRQIELNSAWSSIPAGKVIKAGDTDQRIPLIK